MVYHGGTTLQSIPIWSHLAHPSTRIQTVHVTPLQAVSEMDPIQINVTQMPLSSRLTMKWSCKKYVTRAKMSTVWPVNCISRDSFLMQSTITRQKSRKSSNRREVVRRTGMSMMSFMDQSIRWRQSIASLTKKLHNCSSSREKTRCFSTSSRGKMWLTFGKIDSTRSCLRFTRDVRELNLSLLTLSSKWTILTHNLRKIMWRPPRECHVNKSRR